ncbi:agmatinase family protein [Frankia sp. R82]|uniref:agmatinase family protein n=1 Tax=Frankia sp. R82 TaxID=2950553 RepID=UPI002044725A|nr:agmatinase family protein [Frankia sp. R82]MCM3884287.1 agmatinase family protein [Frankia sp. R82]
MTEPVEPAASRDETSRDEARWDESRRDGTGRGRNSREEASREGSWAQQAEARLGSRRWKEEVDRALTHGLTAADSITDRDISTFARGELPHFAGERGTFLKCPYVEDVHDVGDAEVAVFGAPLDAGTTYRPGTRFGPQGIRRATNLFGTYSYELGIDLREQLNMVDIGDVFTIPGNLEKSFDQISRAIGHVASCGVFPVVLGGDHSIGYPTVRGLAPHVEGNIGIIHFDRHVDTQELDLDERMHTTPWFHATNIPNAPPTNLVQIGIGGWQAPRAGVKVGRARGTTVMTVGDVERVGIDKIAEVALELAWQGAKAVYLSFDIDVIDSGFVPGTGWPEPGGLLPREALGLVRRIAEGGLSGMEVVECSPPYDWAEQTSLLSARVILDTLASLVRVGRLGRKPATRRTDAWGPYPDDTPSSDGASGSSEPSV